MKELLEKRNRLIAAARAILDLAQKESRSMTAEEDANYSKAFKDAQELQQTIDQGTQLSAFEQRLGQLQERTFHGDPNDRGAGGAGEERSWPSNIPKEWRAALAADPRNSREFRAAFNNYLIGGMNGLSGDQRELLVTTSSQARGDRPPLALPAELRALSAGTDTAGGSTVPVQFAAELIKAKDDLLWVRRRATTKPTITGASMGYPSLDSDPSDAEWTHELAMGTEDSSMATGKREVTPHPLAKYIKVSKKLIRVSALNIDALVRDRLAYKSATAEENGFFNGNGPGVPMGVFTASDRGIPTSRDVSTGHTATELRYDGLIKAKYALYKYWNDPSMAWGFHPDALEMISKLRDGMGNYIWRENVRVGEPSMLLGFPVEMSAYIPHTFTAGLYVGILGAWSNYWIQDALDMEIQVATELLILTNQNLYVIRSETDGMPVLSEAFRRVTLAAA